MYLSFMVQRYDNPPKLLLHNFRGILPKLNKMFTLGHLQTSLHGTRLITFLENRPYLPSYSLKSEGLAPKFVCT